MSYTLHLGDSDTQIPEWKILERQKAMANRGRYDGLIKASNAGVKIAFGTDAGSPVVGHEIVAPELKFMIELGIKKDNYDALRCATIVAAEVSKIDDHLGTLEVGKSADVIVMSGNPPENLDALEGIEMTFIAGKDM
ncbi:MAG: amidohydrolase family protein, partial [Phototrophicaceae bacterium]